jgi:hypothetical protein
VHDGHTVVHCRCVHCGNAREKPGEERGRHGSSIPLPNLFRCVGAACHALGHLSKIRRKGNEVRSGADTWDECSSVYSCATASVVHADGETRTASHISRQCATCSSESDKHQVRGRVCGPLIRRKCRAVETESAHSSFR